MREIMSKDFLRRPQTKEIIYVEGEAYPTYWVLADGERVKVARSWAENEVCQGRARYVRC